MGIRNPIPSTEVATIIGVSNFTRGNTNNLTLNVYKGPPELPGLIAASV